MSQDKSAVAFSAMGSKPIYRIVVEHLEKFFEVCGWFIVVSYIFVNNCAINVEIYIRILHVQSILLNSALENVQERGKIK